MSESTPHRSRVLITGATGFVGTALISRLRNDSHFRVRASSRRISPAVDGVEFVVVQDCASHAVRPALNGVDTVIHLAARVHVMREASTDPLAQFRLVNTAGTDVLATQAARAGVRRFVYLSSIKVNGEKTFPGRPFTERDKPAPIDAYGISKFEAELALQKIARETGMEVVVIRPPLVYGAGVKANFRRMMQWLRRRVPLPFGAVHNYRSLVGLDNLVDLIITCARHPNAANETFLAGDGEDLSTTQLLRRLAAALGYPARLFPVPRSLLRFGFAMINQREMEQRLCGSLQVDISRAYELLGWRPPLSVDEGLRRVAMDFLVDCA